MKIHIANLELVCRHSVEIINFGDFSYFYGEIGAGKSTIARLVDYCFGGDLVMTPALQSEFVEVTMRLALGDTPCILTRERGSGQIRATWGEVGDQSQIVIPAKGASGIVLEGTEVEVLSDLLFHLCGITPPRVRRSQIKEDSELERLSFRDLFWYCYLDQDHIDSSFFNLDREAENFRRLKSRNVLRYVLGIHQERVAELEIKLEEKRELRLQADQAAMLLQQTLNEANLGSARALKNRGDELRKKRTAAFDDLSKIRAGLEEGKEHATDKLRHNARAIAGEIEPIEDAVFQIDRTISEDQRHLNEIIALSTKVMRVTSARSILSDVAFERCPRCTQPFPERPEHTCVVCGQHEPEIETESDAIAVGRKDLDLRVKELREMLAKQQEQKRSLQRRLAFLKEKKLLTDNELSKSWQNYDPTKLANIVSLEREMAGYEQEEKYLDKLANFLHRVDLLRKEAAELLAKEQKIRRDLRDAREKASKDTNNIKRLTELFADCLVRAKLPGFTETDKVTMETKWYLPEVIRADVGDIATISFATLGSGGVKTLFKACFALAIHRLAAEIDANLPTLIIIDSPMKNISERVNREQFEGFHALLYELADGELRDTQFILIDKEYCAPKGNSTKKLMLRHMKVDDEAFPPLIRYYRNSGVPATSAPTSEVSDNQLPPTDS